MTWSVAFSIRTTLGTLIGFSMKCLNLLSAAGSLAGLRNCPATNFSRASKNEDASSGIFAAVLQASQNLLTAGKRKSHLRVFRPISTSPQASGWHIKLNPRSSRSRRIPPKLNAAFAASPYFTISALEVFVMKSASSFKSVGFFSPAMAVGKPSLKAISRKMDLC